MKNKTALVVVFLSAFAYFYSIQFSSPAIPGFDGYYHIKLASLIGKDGIRSQFPWLWHTFWREHFVDVAFFYHILLVPFTYLDLAYGAKLSTVVFFAVLSTLLFFSLKTAKVPWPWVWVIILGIGSLAFLQRAILPRAPLVALSFLILGWYFQAEQKHKCLAALSFLFVWLYGGFTLLPALIFFITLSRWILEKELVLKDLIITLSGISGGLILNPYFPENLNFLVTQTVHAGLRRNIIGGGEWGSYDLLGLSWAVRGPGLILIVSSLLLLLSRQRPKSDSAGWFLFSIFTLLMTLNSRRFVEYLVPALVIASALIFRDAAGRWILKFQGILKSPFAHALIIMILLLAGSQQWLGIKTHITAQHDPERYKPASLWLKENTPGSLVYLTDWDDFPELFFHNDKNKYLIGLDPAFLFEYSPLMYNKWSQINAGAIKEDPYPVFKELFNTPYIFTDLHHGPLIKILNDHPRIRLEYKDAYCRIYSLI